MPASPVARVALLSALVAAALGGAPSVAAADCALPANAVVAENCQPGSPRSEWDVDGAGSAGIQGFATDISVNRGETVQFKVDTPASAYRLDIYRMGYYGGAGARKVASVLPSVSLPQSQPGCASDGQTGRVDCGNWAVSASWAVPGGAVSGVYFAHLVRTDGTAGDSHIVFVVRDDGGSSSLLFQTSDTTWQAYNQYGGNSLYVGSPGIDPGRAYAVSYNRPFTTRGSSAEDWVFNAEYPMIRWLERNGYDVSYSTGVDTDRRGELIRNHRVFVSVGHDEYWSGTQRANVEAARDAGVNLAFFSGNEVFWKTRWEDNHRTLVSYKETHNSEKKDPTSTWTGSWRDPRAFNPEGAHPENALTGTIFTVNAGDRDLQVPADDGRLRLWRGTGVASNAAAGQTSSLGQNTVGYEWDEDLDNGARPAGLVRLSTTTATGVEVIQDFGHTYALGTATHHLTLYRDTNGAGPDALVFGAGTVQWSWGLDSEHDRGSAAADSSMEQATVNLFADMGAQPGSLQAGTPAAASTDTQAPSTSITSPAGGSTVSAGSPVTLSGTAADAGGRVGAVEVSVDGGASWHPARGRESWSYTWTPTDPGPTTLLARAADDSANLGAAAQVTVNVPARTCPCSLFGDAVPAKTANDGNAVVLGVRFTPDADGEIRALRYYSPGGTGVRLGHLWSANGTQKLAEVTFPATQGWHEVALATPVAVTAGTTYVASFYAADGQYAYTDNFFLDAYHAAPLHAPATGNGIYAYVNGGGFPNTPSGDAANYFADVAFVSNDHTPPRVTDVSPADGATGVDTRAALAAIFDEAIEPSSVSNSTFLLRDGTGVLVPAGVSYFAATRTATLTPRTRLAPGVRYSAVLKGGAGGVRDTSVNALAQDRLWSFTTAPQPGGGGGSGEAGGGSGAAPGAGAGAGAPDGGPAGGGPRVRITPRSARVSRTGTVALRIACPRDAGSCRVKLSLRLGRKIVAARTLSVPGGKTKTATLRLSRAARRTVARKSSLSVVVSATARDSAGRQATTRTSIRLRAPRS